MPTQQMPNRRPTSGAPRSQSRSTGTGRPAGQRPSGQHGYGQRPPQYRTSGQRPAQGNRRPPQRRKRKPQGRFYAIIAAAVILLIVLIVLIVKLTGGNDTQKPAPVQTVAPATTDATPDVAAASHADSLAAMLNSNDASAVTALDASQMAQVTDLSVTQGLNQEWMNILLLGSDERILTDSARTDSMIICSIHLPTGKVKLTSIMRDLAVEFDDIGEYNGTYRINAANYFGGEKLAMKTVNELFGLNIEKYVRVNFYGFQQIAHMLGGIEMTITEDEMNLINEYIVDQAAFAYYSGVNEDNLPKEFLQTYGDNVHLDGRQALAYARIRKLDGGDFARAERQRKVLAALMETLKDKGAADLLELANAAMPHLRTNLDVAEIVAVAVKVIGAGVPEVESFRLPVNNSYVQESRNEQSMFYDCDWGTNTAQLHAFIYE